MKRLVCAIFVAICLVTPLIGGDWVHWRGLQMNGTSNEKNLPDRWTKEGENLQWHLPHGSRATPMVMGDRVYLINRAGSGETLQERVMALDLESGKILWEHRFNVFLTDIVEHRLGWAQLSGDPETGYVYAHGVQGLLTCLDKNGKVVWSVSLTETFGRISGYGGRTHSPIVEGDMLIIGSCYSGWGSYAKPLHRITARDKRTGEILWWFTSPGKMLDTTYSVPVVATLNGVRTLFAGFADGTVQALKVNTGEPIWSYRLSKRGINTSVVYHDGKVYASHSEENFGDNTMGGLVCIDATKTGDITETGTIWRANVAAGYASPTLHDGLLYVADNSANIHCLDAETGESLWVHNYGTAARGSALYADGKLYIGEVGGEFHIIKASRAGAEELNSVGFAKEGGSPIEIFSSPSVANGRVLLATKDDLYCIASKPGKITASKAAKSKPKTKAGKAAVLQIVPAEIWLGQGESKQFTARTFDAKGNPVGTVKAKWSAKGVDGTINAKGQFKAAASQATQAGSIDAQYKGLTASARIRIVPNLPYRQDFENLAEGSSPPGWITAPSKSLVVTMDGNKVLKKTANRSHPAFARMRNYMLPPLDPGFTVQADMHGQSKKRRFYPDMGLINCRYMLRIMGTTRKPVVRLVSWDPIPRIQKDVDFDWKPDTWYTAKLSYDVVDGKGIVRGKVWPRGEKEPDQWTIEMVDSTPNDGGSPGLYGYSVAISEKSHGTEVFYDNVLITKN